METVHRFAIAGAVVAALGAGTTIAVTQNEPTAVHPKLAVVFGVLGMDPAAQCTWLATENGQGSVQVTWPADAVVDYMHGTVTLRTRKAFAVGSRAQAALLKEVPISATCPSPQPTTAAYTLDNPPDDSGNNEVEPQ